MINQFGEEFERLVMQTLMGPYGPEFEADLEKAFGDGSAVDASPSGARHTQKRLRKR